MGEQIWTIVAVVVGSLLSHVVTARQDRRRLKADDARRWMADRRTMYAALLRAFEDQLAQHRRLLILLPETDEYDDIERTDFDALIVAVVEPHRDLENRITPMLDEVRLLASRSVGDGAHGVAIMLDRLCRSVKIDHGEIRSVPIREVHADAVAEVASEIEGLRWTMRGELGVPDLPIDKLRTVESIVRHPSSTTTQRYRYWIIAKWRRWRIRTRY